MGDRILERGDEVVGADLERVQPLWVHLTATKRVTATSLGQAAEKVRAYIDERDLGARGFSGGVVVGPTQFSGGVVQTSADAPAVAYVSYNGRVWNVLSEERG